MSSFNGTRDQARVGRDLWPLGRSMRVVVGLALLTASVLSSLQFGGSPRLLGGIAAVFAVCVVGYSGITPSTWPAAARSTARPANKVAPTGPAITVELLYFRGCPNVTAYLPHLRRLLPQAVELVLREVATDEAAQHSRFLGSPTVRVDGRDIEPEADDRAAYGLQCRRYRTAEGWSGVPPDAWLLNALRRAVPHVV